MNYSEFLSSGRVPVILLLLLGYLPLLGQVDYARDSLRMRGLMETADYTRAIALADSVLTSATEAGHHFTHQVLYVREQLAYAYDRLGLEEKGLELAKTVITDAETAGDFRTQAEARLTAALIREKHGMGESCLAELERVDRLLRNHDLPAAQARYFLRKASYHRIFGNPDSLGIYAGWAVTKGKQAGVSRIISDGTMLYAMAYSHDKEAVYRMIREAIQYSKESGHYEQWVDLQFNLSMVMERYGDKDAARDLNEQIMAELGSDSSRRYPDDLMLHAIYEQRADYLADANKYREAFKQLKESNFLERQFFNRKFDQQVRDVEAKYNFELKDAELREQEAEVQRQKDLKNWLIRGLLLVLGLAGMLGFQSVRLQRARRAVSRQAAALSVANGELEGALDQQVMLRSELHHRVKNNLQVIISLLDLQEDRETNPGAKSTLRSTSERVYSIAAVHELLYPKQQLDRLNFRTYLDKLCQHSSQMWATDQQPAFAVEVGDQTFNLDTLIPLGVVVSELLTNSRKNFNKVNGHPQIGIRLEKEDDGSYTLRYRDNGPGFTGKVMQERQGGLGSYLIRSMSHQLQGRVITYNDGGAVTEVSFREKNSPKRLRATVQNKKMVTGNIAELR